MGKSSVFPFLHPFNAVGTSPCSLSTDDVSVFFSSLSDDIKKLRQSLEDGSVSLPWLIEAMNLLKKMQIELLVLLKKFRLPVSYGEKHDWFDQYMQETKTLLDFCNSLKLAVSGINRHRMLVELVIQNSSIVDPSSTDSKKSVDIERFEMEHKIIFDARAVRETVRIDAYGMGSEGSNKHEKCIGGVMLAAKSTMIVVSLLVISAVVSPVPIEIRTMALTCEIANLKPFMVLLMALVERFREKVSGDACGPVLMEHEVVHSVLADLKTQVVNGVVQDRASFQNGIQLLRTRSGELRDSIEMFEAVVDEVFDVVIKGRNEMLGALMERSL